MRSVDRIDKTAVDSLLIYRALVAETTWQVVSARKYSYGYTRSYGLLMPGCLFAGIGIGLAFERAVMLPEGTVSIG